MTHRQLTLPLPGQPPAVLTLPAGLTAQRLLDLEQALALALGRLHHELGDDEAAPGQREYASWLRQLRSPAH